MKHKVILLFASVFIYQIAISQCQFDRDEFDNFEQTSIVETTLEKIYHKGSSNVALKIGIGNIGLDNNYIRIVPLVLEPWTINREHKIEILLSNKQILELHPKNSINSEMDFVEFIGLLYHFANTQSD